MLKDLEQRDDVVALAVGGGDGQLLDRGQLVRQLAGQARVLASVGFCDGEDRGRGVDGRDVLGRGQAGGALGEDAAAAANVEVRDAGVWDAGAGAGGGGGGKGRRRRRSGRGFC